MSTQRLTWIALPCGRTEDGRPRLSAYLVPRLEDAVNASPTIETDFPDFLDWPAIVNDARFAVQLPGGRAISTVRLGAPADPGLWQRLFPGETPVRAFAFKDHSARRIRSYPVRDVLGYVRDLYRDVARTSGADLPPAPGAPGAHPALERLVDDLGGLLGVNPDTVRITEPGRLRQWAKLRYHDDDLWQHGRRALNFHGPVPARYGGSRPAFHFAAALRFYGRPESSDPYVPAPKADLVPPPPHPPEVDFHQMLTLLGDHPALLRLLGLVVDLALDEEPPAPVGRLRVSPAYEGRHPAPTLPSFRPWTAYRLDGGLFVPEPAGDDVGEGMLRLEGADDALDPAAKSLFDLVQVDPDGAALKLTNTASSLYGLDLAGKRNLTGIDAPNDAGLPTLRSGGLAIVRSDRAALLAKRVADALGWNLTADEDDVELHADELTRGYRLDVARGAHTWRSLHRRRGRYLLHGAPVEDANGESEFVDESYVKASSVTSRGDAGSDLYLHETVARWSGWSLAAERPGRLTYPKTTTDGDQTLQAESVEDKRAPDLATFFQLDARYDVLPGSLPRLRFGNRYRLRARAVDLAGNSLPHDDSSDRHASEWIDYLRYEPIGPPDLLALTAFGPGEALERLVVRSNFDRSIDAPSERHVVPPKTSQFLAELHGVFDDAIGTGRPHDAAHDVAAQEALQLTDASGTIKQPGGPRPPASEWPADRDAPGAYYVNPERKLVLPYLPDVLSSGASFRGLPGSVGPDAALQDWGDEKWPNAQPFILRIEERPANPAGIGACEQVFDGPPPEPKWDPEARVLTVRLSKGESARVRYSSSLPPQARDLLGVWRWATGVADDELERLALEGSHWMLTPFRTLTLVHAVQQPLCRPSVLPPDFPDEFGFEGIEPTRPVGATYADLSAHVLLSIRTTALLDIDAEWTEQIDDKTQPGPAARSGKAHVATVPVPVVLPEGPHWVPFRLEHQRIVDPVRHEFGDTKHRLVRYLLTATTRFREYFPPDTAPITQAGDWVSAHVPSSARPDAPKVLYAVPTFAWTRTRTPDDRGWRSAEHVRSGGGLRVYMERSWFSSGDDELLGAVIWTGGGIPDPWLKLVSQIGRDPIWDTQPPAALRAADFSGVARTESGLGLAERSDGNAVAVVGYQPTFDAERGLWFADLILPGPANRSYFPFVRLALARYQHYSISADLKLSTVTPLDFAQLAPNRTLKVDLIDDRSLDVSLSGVGPDGPNANSVEVTIETHDGAVPGELGWRRWPDLPPLVLHEGVRDPGAWLSHFGLQASTVKALDLEQRLSFRSAREHAHAVAPIDPGHLPLVESAHAVDLGLFPSWADVDKQIPIAALFGHRVWSGRVQLPAVRGERPLRLVVREYESYETDAEAAGSANPEPRTYHARRVVFVDTIEL
jgi:hypothetical protein